MKQYQKSYKDHSKISIAIFENGVEKQSKNPDKLINVCYGLKVVATRNNLEDVKLLITNKMLMLDFDLSDGLIAKSYVEKQKTILKQLEKSVDKTINEMFGKGERK